MKVRALLTLVLSLCIAGLAAMVANSWISQRLGAAEHQQQTGQVVVTTGDIPVGAQLQATHLKVMPLPSEAISEDSITNLDDALGRVVTQPLYEGEILTEKRLTLFEGGSPLAAVIENGKRALAVRVNDVIGVAGFLLPSNRVDVVSTKREAGNRGMTSKTIVENLKVLAVDQTVSSDKNDPVIVRAVTLEVTPSQAEQIVKATEEGKLQLTLRNPLDKATASPKADPTKTVVKTGKKASVTKRSFGYRVDVIKGIEKSRILVTN